MKTVHSSGKSSTRSSWACRSSAAVGARKGIQRLFRGLKVSPRLPGLGRKRLSLSSPLNARAPSLRVFSVGMQRTYCLGTQQRLAWWLLWAFGSMWNFNHEKAQRSVSSESLTEHHKGGQLVGHWAAVSHQLCCRRLEAWAATPRAKWGTPPQPPRTLVNARVFNSGVCQAQASVPAVVERERILIVLLTCWMSSSRMG